MCVGHFYPPRSERVSERKPRLLLKRALLCAAYARENEKEKVGTMKMVVVVVFLPRRQLHTNPFIFARARLLWLGLLLICFFFADWPGRRRWFSYSASVFSQAFGKRASELVADRLTGWFAGGKEGRYKNIWWKLSR